MTGFVERLAGARIGAHLQLLRATARVRRCCGERLAAYLDERAAAPILLVAEAPGYRGTRVSGIPLTSERQLTGEGPAEATATVVHGVLAELGLADDVLLWNVVPTHPGDAALEPPADAAARSSRACRSCASWRAAAASSPSAASRTRRSAARTSAIPSHGGAAEFRRGLRELLARYDGKSCTRRFS